jgi:hypothetical protein
MPTRDQHPLHSRKQQTNRKQACVHCEQSSVGALINSVLKMS